MPEPYLFRRTFFLQIRRHSGQAKVSSTAKAFDWARSVPVFIINDVEDLRVICSPLSEVGSKRREPSHDETELPSRANLEVNATIPSRKTVVSLVGSQCFASGPISVLIEQRLQLEFSLHFRHEFIVQIRFDVLVEKF